MLIRWFLFETRVGHRLLALLERYVGVAVVSADWLAMQTSGQPSAAAESRSVLPSCSAQE